MSPGDISPVTELETIFQNVVVLIGACFLAGFIGSFAEYLSHNDESGQSAYETKMRKLQDYMSYRNLPHDLQREILFFHHHKWNNSKLLDEREVINILPLPLQMDLSFEILGSLIKQFPVLTELKIRVQKRICHALSMQVSPPKATIYRAGDIGWDLYFIGSGLVQLSLPSNTSVLDEEGKANEDYIKRRASSVGLLYRPGNHFGESCLRSHSGVRQETVKAKTIATLYFISKESLEQIFDLMGIEEKIKLTKNLINRNGNVWHSFDEDQKIEQEVDKEYLSQSKRSSNILSKSDRFTAIQARQSKKSTLLDERNKSRRRSTRLRSFSAEASAQAIRQSRNSYLVRSNQLGEIDENTNHMVFYLEAATKIANTAKNVISHIEECDSDTSTSSNTLIFMKQGEP